MYRSASYAALLIVLVAGSVSLRAQAVLYSVSGPVNALIGSSVAAVGDIDGDGICDFVSPGSDGANKEEVYLYSGRTGSLLHLFTSPESFSAFGGALAGKGDVTGDGIPDIVIGAPIGGGDEHGSAYVYSGADFSLIRSYHGAPYAKVGSAVAILGDLDGDGAAEYAICASNTGFLGSKIGVVTVYSGLTGIVLHTISALSANTNFGRSIARLNDVTGDGIPDIAISEPGFSSAGFMNNGSLRIFSGVTGTLYASGFGSNDGAEVGGSLAAMGDVNGDGKADLVASFYDTNAFVAGARVFSGADGSTITTSYGDLLVGRSLLPGVASSEDLDGDGKDDILFKDLSDADPGQLMLASSATGKHLYVTLPVSSPSVFPSGIDGLGDIDGDGFPEFIVGDPASSPAGGHLNGTVWVFTTRPLHASPPVLSASAPSSVDFTLSPGVGHAGSVYLVLASVSPEGGGCGGFNVGPDHVHVPFCYDELMDASLALVNTSIFVTTFGSTDPYTGLAKAKLDATGAALPPGAVGLELTFFFLTKVPDGGPWDKAWQAETIAIGP